MRQRMNIMKMEIGKDTFFKAEGLRPQELAMKFHQAATQARKYHENPEIRISCVSVADGVWVERIG